MGKKTFAYNLTLINSLQSSSNDPSNKFRPSIKAKNGLENRKEELASPEKSLEYVLLCNSESILSESLG